jgi:hypothetical protein
MLETILAILATYRVARMLTTEDGPFDLFAKLRERIDPRQETWVGRGINCPLCVGFWVSFAVSLVFLPWSSLASLLLNWLGVAGGSVVLHNWVEK